MVSLHDTAMENAFNEAQPLCLEIFTEKDPTSLGKRLEKLLAFLERLPKYEVSGLSSFLSIPIQHVLKQAPLLDDRTLINALRIMEMSLQESSLPVEPIPFNFFQILIPNLLSLLTDPREVGKLKGSTELRLSVVKTVYRVLEARKPLQCDSLPVVAQAIYILLQILGSDSNLQLRNAVLDCLDSLCGCGRVQGSREVLQDRLTAFLPGLSSNLVELVTKNALLHHSLIVRCLALFKQILIAVFNDDRYGEASDSGEAGDSQEKSSLSREWLVSKANILRPLISKLVAVSGFHSSFEVRLGTADFCLGLLENCSGSMASSTSPIFDVFAKLMKDEHPKVRERTARGIRKLKKSSKKWSNQFVVIQENIFNLCTKLPGLVRNGSVAHSSDVIQQLMGYLLILGPTDVTKLLRSSEHSRRLWKSLIQSVEFEPKNLSMVSEVEAMNSTESAPDKIQVAASSLPLKSGCSKSIEDVCIFLGSTDLYGNLLSSLLDLYPAPSSNLSEECQFLFILNSFLQGSANAEVRTKNEILPDILPSLSEQIMQRISECNHDETPRDSIIQDQASFPTESALLAMLLLHVSGSISRLYAFLSLDMSQLLLETLYPVLLKSESRIHPVKDASFSALKSLARSSGNDSICGLLEASSDYLLYSVSMKLRRLPSHPLAPLAFLSFVRNGSTEVVAKTRDLVEDLLCAIDVHHNELCFLPLKALVVYVGAVAVEPKQAETEPIAGTSEALEETEEADEEEMKEIPKPPTPAAVRIVVGILKRTKHLVSSQHLPLRMLTLDLIRESLEKVQHWDDELLPMIHQNWPGVVARFDDWERLVSIKSLEVILTMARLSGDFVCRKICDDLFPRVFSFLRSSAEKSRGTGKFYAQSSAGKLQRYLLEIIGPLCKFIAPLSAQILGELDEILRMYETGDQPEGFRAPLAHSLQIVTELRK